MTLLTRESVLAAQDLKSEDIAVPEWGGDLRIRTMTGTARDALLQGMTGPDGKFESKGYRTRLLAATIVDEHGNTMFTAEELDQKNPLITDRLFLVADRLNAIGNDKVEEAEKN